MYRLALALGRADPERLLDELDSVQISQWQAYEAVEGWLGPRGDWERIGELLAAFYNANRNPRKNPQPFKPADFYPWTERTAMTPKVWRALFAGRIKKKGAK